ncbi:MAG: DUF4124 domain-containing protein [Syntrophaceae bacterium]|nr:DUF4124 domain-containing protein [Syntrophaceae bacterium]
MKRKRLIIIAALLLFASAAFGQEIYRWVDEKGTLHFTDDLEQIPEKYREKVQKEKSPQEPTPAPPVSLPTPPPKGGKPGKESKPAPPPQEKDIFGRGEEWWGAKAREWNEKFKTAQKNYEKTNQEWKSKEKELEISTFKPDSFKRKLKAEIKVLEEKVKDWEKQMQESKNMLEHVLPKQAREDGANPDWLKIEEKK